MLRIKCKFLDRQGIFNNIVYSIDVLRLVKYYEFVHQIYEILRKEKKEINFTSVELYSETGCPLAPSPNLYLEPLHTWELMNDDLIYAYPKKLFNKYIFGSDIDCEEFVISIQLKDSNIRREFIFNKENISCFDLKIRISLDMHILTECISIHYFNIASQCEEVAPDDMNILKETIGNHNLSFTISDTYFDNEIRIQSVYTSCFPSSSLPKFHTLNADIQELVREYGENRDKDKLLRKLGLLKRFSYSPPLVHALYFLFTGSPTSLPHKIAINEGIITTIHLHSASSDRPTIMTFTQVWRHIEEHRLTPDLQLTVICRKTPKPKRTQEKPGKDEGEIPREGEEIPRENGQEILRMDEEIPREGEQEKAKEDGQDIPRENEEILKESEEIPRENGQYILDITREGEEIPREGDEIPRDGEDILKESEEIPRENGQEIQREGEDIPKEGEEIPREGEEIPREGEDIPREGEEIPREGEEIPREGEDIPKEGEEIPREGEEIPREGEDIPREGEEIPREGEDIPKEGEEIPREGEEIPREGEDIPREGEEIPREGEDIPREGEEIPREGEEIPREGEEIPREGEEIPREGEDIPREGEEIPREGEEIPREGEEIPREGEEIPREGAEIPREGKEIPREGEDTPREGEDILREGEDIPREKETHTFLQVAPFSQETISIKLNAPTTYAMHNLSKIIIILGITCDISQTVLGNIALHSEPIPALTHLNAAINVIETLIDFLIRSQYKCLLGAIVISNDPKVRNAYCEIMKPTIEYGEVLKELKLHMEKFKHAYYMRSNLSDGIIVNSLDFCINSYSDSNEAGRTEIFLFTNSKTNEKHYGTKITGFKQRLHNSSCVLNNFILSDQYSHNLEELSKLTKGVHVTYKSILKCLLNENSISAPTISVLKGMLSVSGQDANLGTYELLCTQLSGQSISIEEFLENSERDKEEYQTVMAYVDSPSPHCKLYHLRNEVLKWIIFMQGPIDSPFEGSIFIMELNFGEQYPHYPPKLRFLSSVYHPNVDTKGYVCHPILKEKYTRSVSLRQILDAIHSMLAQPIVSHAVRIKVLETAQWNVGLYNQIVNTFCETLSLKGKTLSTIEQDFKI